MPMCPPPPSSREVEFTPDVVRTGQVSADIHVHHTTSIHILYSGKIPRECDIGDSSLSGKELHAAKRV